MKPTILSCAVTGSFTSREHNANLPVTPEEIAGECIAAAIAGAAICHIHVRDPETGAPSMALEYYREVMKRIRESDTDLIINLEKGSNRIIRYVQRIIGSTPFSRRTKPRQSGVFGTKLVQT